MLEQYAKELEQDLELTLLNIKDRQLSHPNIRHKWLFRLIQHKKNVARIREDIEDLTNDLTDKEFKISKISLPKLKAKIEKDPSCIDYKRKLKNEQQIVEYLEGVQSILSSMSYDMKNVVDILKLENY